MSIQYVSTPNHLSIAPASHSNPHQTDSYKMSHDRHLPVLHSTRVRILLNVWGSHQTSRHVRGGMKLLTNTEPTNQRCHCTKFSRPFDLAPGTCGPLVLSMLNMHETTPNLSSLNSLSLNLSISAQYTDRKRLSLIEHKKAIKYPGVTVRKNVKEGNELKS